jgi:hypothetical protein
MKSSLLTSGEKRRKGTLPNTPRVRCPEVTNLLVFETTTEKLFPRLNILWQTHLVMAFLFALLEETASATDLYRMFFALRVSHEFS